MIDLTERIDKKPKKSKKKRKDKIESGLKANEVLPEKGVYYDHQVGHGTLFCIDKKGDQENRIFKKIYNGELPVYKSLNKHTLSVSWIPKKKKIKDVLKSRYYSKENRKILCAAPAPTAQKSRARLKVQQQIDEGVTKLTIFENELVTEETENDNEIDIIQLKELLSFI